ncbi:MAG: DUF4382 domain-containing protein [Woeseia sp.]
MRSITLGTIAAIPLLLLAGCNSDGSDPAGEGTLTIGLTDGPVESAERVVIAFSGIELKQSGAAPLDPITLDEASCDDFDAATGTCSIDLLTLTGTNRKVVFNETIDAGQYEWVRLMVDAERNVMDSYIEFEDGTSCPLYIPSGSETGLKIVSGITVTANGMSDYTLDFDVRKSVTAPPGLQTGDTEACTQNYILKPAIRIVDTTEVGAIGGTVDEQLLADAECTVDDVSGLYQNTAVYIFENFDGAAVADDLDEDATHRDPVTTASVVFDGDPAVNAYVYEAGYLLAPEDYLAALTCSSDLDDAATDDLDPTSEPIGDFTFIAERTVVTEVDTIVDGSFSAAATE